MGDSCSSPRTASSRVSPRRATGSLLIVRIGRSYRANLSHRYIERVNSRRRTGTCDVGHTAGRRWSGRGADPSPVHPVQARARPLPLPGVAPVSPDRKATPSRGGSGPKKTAAPKSRRAPTSSTAPTSRKAAKPGSKTASRQAAPEPRSADRPVGPARRAGVPPARRRGLRLRLPRRPTSRTRTRTSRPRRPSSTTPTASTRSAGSPTRTARASRSPTCRSTSRTR